MGPKMAAGGLPGHERGAREPVLRTPGFPQGIHRFLRVPGSPRESPGSSGGAHVAPGSAPGSPRGTPGALEGVWELQQVPQMGPSGPKSLPRGTLNGSGNGLRASFSAMRSSLRIGVLNVWTKNVPLLVKFMLRTPVRCTALNYFFGVGGSGRRPLESADPRSGGWGGLRYVPK